MGAWGHGIFDSDQALDGCGFFEEETGVCDLDFWEEGIPESHNKESLSDEEIALVKEKMRENRSKALEYINATDHEEYLIAVGALCLMYNLPLDEPSLSKIIEATKEELQYASSYTDPEERKSHLNALLNLLENYDPEKEVVFSTEGLLDQFYKEFKQNLH